ADANHVRIREKAIEEAGDVVEGLGAAELEEEDRAIRHPLEGPRKDGLVRRRVEIRVEGHREVAQEDAAERRRSDLGRSELDESVGDAGLETRQRERESLVEVDAKALLDLALDDEAVAEQVADDGPPELVVSREARAAKRRRARVRDRGRVGGQLP